ncbi:MAG: hypothetical protein ING69_10520 [Rhodocyclaceae bacterium]|nr:hypothetical protein [Rhodocyclaceae bacterium]
MSDSMHQQAPAQVAQTTAAPAPATSTRASGPLLLLAAASAALLAFQIYDKAAMPFHGDTVTAAEMKARVEEWREVQALQINLPAYAFSPATIVNRAREAFGQGTPATVAATSSLAGDLVAAGLNAADIELLHQHVANGDLRFCRLAIADGNVYDGDRIRIQTFGGKIPEGAEGLTIEIDLPAFARNVPVPCGSMVTITAIADGRGGGVVADIAGRRAPVLKINERVNLQAR